MKIIRAGKKYNIEEVLSQRNWEKIRADSKRNFDGDMMKMNSLRLHTFAEKGLKCVCCGIEGKYFVKEKSQGHVSYHFNLYAVDSAGNEVLMTKDHIVAKSKGGEDHIDNMQTMCEACNKAKGNMDFSRFLDTTRIVESPNLDFDIFEATGIPSHLL
jgi:5-methylcytosine-specific restriction endonuclease McrA